MFLGEAYFFYDAQHHCFVSLSRVELEHLLQIGKELSSLFHFLVDLSSLALSPLDRVIQVLTFSTALFHAT